MKDPAALFYIDKWLSSTAEMDSDVRGWYLNLILHQYDKKSLPNDLEKLAVLAGVKFSEFERFKQVFEQVLKQKFETNEDNRLENSFAREIMVGREMFKDKRSNSGKLSYVLKYFRSKFKYNKDFELWFKQNVEIDFDIKDVQVLEKVYKQKFELFVKMLNEGEQVGENLGTMPPKEEDGKPIRQYDFNWWKIQNPNFANNFSQEFTESLELWFNHAIAKNKPITSDGELSVIIQRLQTDLKTDKERIDTIAKSVSFGAKNIIWDILAQEKHATEKRQKAANFGKPETLPNYMRK